MLLSYTPFSYFLHSQPVTLVAEHISIERLPSQDTFSSLISVLRHRPQRSKDKQLRRAAVVATRCLKSQKTGHSVANFGVRHCATPSCTTKST